MKHLCTILAFYCAVQVVGAQQKVIDMHVHLWNGAVSIRAYEHKLDSTHQEVTRFGGILIASRDDTLNTRQKNDELVALSKQYPKLFPICSVHPLNGEFAFRELRRLASLSVKIVKLHPHTQDFDVTDEIVPRLCKLAGDLGITILMDNANIKPGDSENLFNLAVNCSGTRFIFAHIGAFNFRFWNIILAARTAKNFYRDNIYFDISATVVVMADSMSALTSSFLALTSHNSPSSGQ